LEAVGVFELLATGLVNQWLSTAGARSGLDLGSFWDLPQAPIVQVAPTNPAPDPKAATLGQRYLAGLPGGKESQGLWLESRGQALFSHNISQPFSAASLTKTATTLVALHTWGVDHRFPVKIYATGPIENGVLSGDLVLQGHGNPALISEDAIALGNQLQTLGIRQVTGNLVLVGNLWLNFERNPAKVATQLRQSLNSATWSADLAQLHAGMAENTPKPRVAIAGQSMQADGINLPNIALIGQYEGLPLWQILRVMNVNSSNYIAQAVADNLGGAQVVAQQSAAIARFPTAEISLSNGSGLGVENKISPRAVGAMFGQLQRYLAVRNLALGDLFPVSGLDGGAIEDRTMPDRATVKTGTLLTVSALAGAIPTRDRGLVWFTIINNQSSEISSLRRQQDQFLQTLVNQWGPSSSQSIAPHHPLKSFPKAERLHLQAVDAAVRQDVMKGY
jgi:serine-type D-Ala-D-Ala carboxypeptidase/endopeptidase (penicillin-binding protein 4)